MKQRRGGGWAWEGGAAAPCSQYLAQLRRAGGRGVDAPTSERSRLQPCSQHLAPLRMTGGVGRAEGREQRPAAQRPGCAHKRSQASSQAAPPPLLTACPGRRCPASPSRRRCRAAPPRPCPPAVVGGREGGVGRMRGARAAERCVRSAACCVPAPRAPCDRAHAPPALHPPTLMPGMMPLPCSILTKGVPSEADWNSVSSKRICGRGP